MNKALLLLLLFCIGCSEKNVIVQKPFKEVIFTLNEYYKEKHPSFKEELERSKGPGVNISLTDSIQRKYSPVIIIQHSYPHGPVVSYEESDLKYKIKSTKNRIDVKPLNKSTTKLIFSSYVVTTKTVGKEIPFPEKELESLSKFLNKKLITKP